MTNIKKNTIYYIVLYTNFTVHTCIIQMIQIYVFRYLQWQYFNVIKYVL